MGIREEIAVEPKSSHCKVYVEPTVKDWIQKYADREGMTFSQAGRKLWLDAIDSGSFEKRGK